MIRLRYYSLVACAVMVTQTLLAEIDPLVEYQRKYEAGLERIELAFREKRLAMPTAQVKALRQLEMQYQRAGDLQGMLTVQQELKRFVLDPRGRAIPDVQAPAELARLLQDYKHRFVVIGQERDHARVRLSRQYVQALQELQVKLTQQGNIEAAKNVMTEIAKHRKEPSSAIAAGSVETAPAGNAATTGGAGLSAQSGDDFDSFVESWFE